MSRTTKKLPTSAKVDRALRARYLSLEIAMGTSLSTLRSKPEIFCGLS